MKNKEPKKYIIEHQLTSWMNNTKWKELLSILNKIEGFNPPVNIKTIYDVSNNGLFSTVWWKDVERDGFNIIEWLEINPLKTTYIGRLVKT